MAFPVAMQVEHNPVALFNIFDAEVSTVNETDDVTNPFTGPGDRPTNFLISGSQRLQVRFSWKAAGVIPSITQVEYTLRVFLERMGASETPDPAPVVFTAGIINPTLGLANYTDTVTVGGRLQEGVYRLVASITAKAVPSNVHLGVAGFADLGIFQVFRD